MCTVHNQHIKFVHTCIKLLLRLLNVKSNRTTSNSFNVIIFPLGAFLVRGTLGVSEISMVLVCQMSCVHSQMVWSLKNLLTQAMFLIHILPRIFCTMTNNVTSPKRT